eukprot:CAMPEP_0119029908 /NCGR_PEP_ID=MMETSP1176-20130426/40762_1 /TAXON_ID=265551 /ORGANISM="Synedropsis recta cf, Strain CCMP1620" /LENGTH=431 /DNA_ID=CAMNT_0006986269 /DNA_START=1126 /DNA_END=2421 /DNA_ORIENTATION=-
MNNSNTITDKDSMMALEALLKIRSDSSAESSRVSPASATPPQRNSAFSIPSPSIIHMAQHFIPMQVVSAYPNYVVAQKSSIPSTGLLKAVDQGQQNIFPSSRASLNTTPAVWCTTPPLITAPKNKKGLTVRQEKINDALHSKPQRGKKRENLSVMERLELTRTRNREHAKSTRVRKKARYQELVDKEVMYDDLKSAADLDDARVDAVFSFIDSREKLLCCSATTSSTRDELVRKALDKTLHNRSTFTLDGVQQGPVPPMSSASAAEQNVDDAMTKMSKLEEVIRCKVARQFGKNAVSKLGYSVVGGRDTIAVTKSGVAMIELSVVIRNKDNNNAYRNGSTIIMSAMIRWNFASQSEKLMGMQWTTISDTLASSNTNNNNKSSHDDLFLGSQTCYPSVVSLLDHNGCVHGVEADKPSSPAQSPGRGSDINRR